MRCAYRTIISGLLYVCSRRMNSCLYVHTCCLYVHTYNVCMQQCTDKTNINCTSQHSTKSISITFLSFAKFYSSCKVESEAKQKRRCWCLLPPCRCTLYILCWSWHLYVYKCVCVYVCLIKICIHTRNSENALPSRGCFEWLKKQNERPKTLAYGIRNQRFILNLEFPYTFLT